MQNISIHTLRVESNNVILDKYLADLNFNPYSPCGE